MTRAADDPVLQEDLRAACKLSILFWANAFCWTYKKQDWGSFGKRRCKQPHVPFITWEIQDQYLAELRRCMVEGESMLTDKSREMGASWCIVTAIHHVWMFEDDMDILELSRKEELVDSAGRKNNDSQSSIDTLFGKHDYLHNWQPAWLKPARTRSTRMMVNNDTRSQITGESANENAGTATRKDVVLIDEMAKMQFGDQIKQSLMSVAPCLLPNSTPCGAGTAYSKWRQSGQIKVFELPWWECPDKGRGRYLESVEGSPLPKIKSPWYNQMEMEMTPKELATELDMNHIESGSVFFEAGALRQHKSLYACNPAKRVSIGIKQSVPNADLGGIIRRRQREHTYFIPAISGDLQIWCELIENRPDQSKTYGLGVDISKGQKASNSVISVVCKQTREKIAEYATATQAPHDFVKTAVAVAMWVGGASSCHLPMICFEANGDPGLVFGKMLVGEFQYPLYWHDRAEGQVNATKTARWGWWSDTAKKEALLGMYRRALSHGGIINHSALALDEAAMYVYFAGGGVGPATLEREDSSARKTHGDRVIADALALLAIGETPEAVKKVIETPMYSFAWFKQQAEQRKKKALKTRKEYQRW